MDILVSHTELAAEGKQMKGFSVQGLGCGRGKRLGWWFLHGWVAGKKRGEGASDVLFTV